MTLRKRITIDNALVVLNRAVESDPEGMARLFNSRVECNEKLGEDPEIQTRKVTKPRSVHDIMLDDGESVEVESGSNYMVGVMGIINGLFGIDNRTGYGQICSVWDLGCESCKPSQESLKDSKGLCPVCHHRMKPIHLTRFDKVEHKKLPAQSDQKK